MSNAVIRGLRQLGFSLAREARTPNSGGIMFTLNTQPATPANAVATQVSTNRALMMLILLVGVILLTGTGTYLLAYSRPIAVSDKAVSAAAELHELRKQEKALRVKVREAEQKYYEAYGQAAYDSIFGALPDSWKPALGVTPQNGNKPTTTVTVEKK